MVSIPDEVRCAVCRSIFCCLDCRNRHEQNSHCPNEVWTERNRLKCGLCQGAPVLEFCNRNDFTLIMHLCQSHLPLHCKKCLTQFNSIGDFLAANKCAHFNDICSLQSPLQTTSHQHSHVHSHSHSQSENHSMSSAKDVSDTNFITAVQKSSFERSICDNSVVSLRNYSTILHTSNHPLYKTQTPVVGKALVRQTSTPMHHNLAIADTAPAALQMQPLHTNGSSCSQCMGASTSSGQLSCINSSSDSDTSISTAVTKPNDIRPNIQQQNIMMATNKTSVMAVVTAAAFKRARKSPNVTPLTRQVMTKSIHRAILEYQHTQSLNAASPKSPLDLRMQQAIYRSRNRTPVKCLVKSDQQIDKSARINGKSRSMSTSMSSSSTTATTTVTTTTVATTIKNAQSNQSSRLPNTLETLYEHEKDANSVTFEFNESNKGETDDLPDALPSKCDAIFKTPTSRRTCISTPDDAEKIDSEVWYTPNEFIQSNVIENVEIFTPKVSKKRVPVWRFDADDSQQQQPSLYTIDSHEQQENSAVSLTSKLSGSKIWTFVSSILRYASLNSPNNLSMQETAAKDNESHVLIRRCASFAGFVREKNVLESSDDDADGGDPLQPIKRRRITSIDAKSIDRMALKYQKRIMCRPPIRRMLNTNE